MDLGNHDRERPDSWKVSYFKKSYFISYSIITQVKALYEYHESVRMLDPLDPLRNALSPSSEIAPLSELPGHP